MLDYATMSFDTLMDKSERSMNGENGLQVTNEPIEVQDFRKIIDHLEYMEYTSNQYRKTKRSQHVIIWTWNR